MPKKSKKDLFMELAQPDENGYSRWVSTQEFVGEYKALQLGNGGDFCRKNSSLSREYNVEFDKSRTRGNRIDAIRLAGFNQQKIFNQSIRKDIKDAISQRRCVMLGVKGNSENTTIEVDHKDGRKNDMRVSNPSLQRIEDFQPLCKAANDIKRQICKRCAQSDKRWDAKNIEGNPYSFYEGDDNYTEQLGCVGCYQYDPVEYRIRSAERLSKETLDYVMNKLYPNNRKENEQQILLFNN